MKLNVIFGAVALATTLAAAPANAVVISGSTAGCFGAGCTNYNTPVTNEDLRFTGVTGPTGFTVNIAAPGNGSATLGTFSLFDNFDITGGLEGDTFRLRVDFSAPAGTTPDPFTFTALLDANLVPLLDELLIDFNNTPQSFNFNGGTFTLAVQDVSLKEFFIVGGPTSANLIGSITVGPPQAEGAVPEPSTWAMMILGFLGVGLTAYRRSRKGGAAAVAA